MDKRFTKKHAYTPGNNPAGPNAHYYCHHCDLDIDGEEIGYVAAGTNYANGEHSACPRCGEENFVERDENEDEISFGPMIAAKVREIDEDNIKEENIASLQHDLEVVRELYKDDDEFIPFVAKLCDRLERKGGKTTHTNDEIKQEIWNRFMENMKHVVKLGEDPILPSNFLGSVKKHKEQFMKIDIRDLTK